MTSQSRKHRGMKSQQLAAHYVRDIWPFADTAGAGRSGQDILNTPGFSGEVKARTGLNLGAWLKQAVEATAPGDYPYLVVRLNGQGEKSIGDWPVVMRYSDWKRLVRQAGYGTPAD
ncbi:hypothetical protein ACWDTT_16060 [Streptosporangium sandarakinum]